MGAVAEAGGRTFAAVAFTWKAAAPFRPQLVAALIRRVSALRAYGVDITLLGPDGAFPAELRRDCRLARREAGGMRGLREALARQGIGPDCCW